MNKTVSFLLLYLFIILSVNGNAQNNRLSLKTGTGYFGDYSAKMFGSNGDFDGFNPKFYDVYNGNALFFELAFRMKNNYSLGAKYTSAESDLPYNDIYLKELLYDYSSIQTYKMVELFFEYNFQFRKQNILIGAGPFIKKLKQSFYDGAVSNIFENAANQSFGYLYLGRDVPIILERELWDIGLNLKVDYEYMFTPSVGLVLKGEAYFLTYSGFAYIFIGPAIVFKY